MKDRVRFWQFGLSTIAWAVAIAAVACWLWTCDPPRGPLYALSFVGACIGMFFVRSKSVALLWPFGIMGGLVLVFAAVSVEIGLPIVWFGAPFPTLRATDVLPLLVPPILVGSAISAFAVCFRLCKDLWQKMLSPN